MDKILKDKIKLAYFTGAQNNIKAPQLYSTIPIYGGEYETNPVIKKAMHDNVKIVLDVGTAPYHEIVSNVVYMPNKQHFKTAADYDFALLHEGAHAIANNTENVKAYFNAQMEYFSSKGDFADHSKLLNEMLKGHKINNVEQKILLTYVKDELQADVVSSAIFEYAGYKSELAQQHLHDSAVLARFIPSAIGQDYRKELYNGIQKQNPTNQYAQETNLIFEDMKGKIKEIEQQLGKTAKEFTKELTPKEKSKDKDDHFSK